MSRGLGSGPTLAPSHLKLVKLKPKPGWGSKLVAGLILGMVLLGALAFLGALLEVGVAR